MELTDRRPFDVVALAFAKWILLSVFIIYTVLKLGSLWKVNAQAQNKLYALSADC